MIYLQGDIETPLLVPVRAKEKFVEGCMIQRRNEPCTITQVQYFYSSCLTLPFQVLEVLSAARRRARGSASGNVVVNDTIRETVEETVADISRRCYENSEAMFSLKRFLSGQKVISNTAAEP